MSTPAPQPRSPYRPKLGVGGFPLLILVIGLALTGLGTLYVSHTMRARAKLRFDALVRQSNDAFTQRIGTYVSLLNGASGLFAAKIHAVDRVSFRAYVDRLGQAMHDPGVIGISYARRMRPEEKGALIASMRAQGYPQFQLWPSSPASDSDAGGERFPILFTEPASAGNRRAVGVDMFSEPTRRRVMRMAADSGEAVASPRVFPLRPTGDVNPTSFLIFLPIYTGGSVPATVAERRQKLSGFVFCPFRSDPLLENTLGSSVGNRLNVAVYDGSVIDEAHLLHRSKSTGTPDSAASDLRETTTLTIADRPWTIVYRPARSFDAGVIDITPYVFVGGLAMSALFFGVALSQMRARIAAEASAATLRQTDAALRASETRARRLIESNLIGVLRADFAGTIREANDALMQLSGLTPDDIEKGQATLAELTPPEAGRVLERALQALRRGGAYPPFETTLQHRDGTRVPVLVGATRLEDAHQSGVVSPDGEQFIAFLLDITERRDVERQLHESEKHQRAFFRDVLASVTEGRLRLCDSPADLPQTIAPPAETTSVTLRDATLKSARQATRQASERAHIPIERAQDLLTAVGEATMNAVVHGGGGIARIGERGGVVQVWVEDQGSGIDVRQLPQATLERGYTTAGSLGHGFWLMLKTVDRLWLLTGPQGTTVVMEQDAVARDPHWMQMPPHPPHPLSAASPYPEPASSLEPLPE